MTADDRLERLEQRVAVLEALVRRLVGQEFRVPRSEFPEEAGPGPPSPLMPPAEAPRPAVEAASAPAPAPAPRGTRNAEPGAGLSPRVRLPTLSEEWLGRHGLLAVGVVFVVLAAGYLLKLSFDRGWISPLVRCTGGAVAGLAVGGLGWRLHSRGTRVYGAALLGTGAAIVYLAVWAAARLYQFLPATPAVGALALVAVALAAIAWAINVEALGAAGAVGAFFAPIVIGREAGSVNLLLLYLGAMGAGLGLVSAARRWRTATFVVALAYFGIATSGVLARATPANLYLYGILGGAAGLFVGLREGWIETRLLAFAGGWGVLAVADDQASRHWPTLAGGIVLVAPVWWRALKARTVWPGATAPSLGDSFYFYLSPLLLGLALHAVAPVRFDRDGGLAPVIVAAPYLVAGLVEPRRPFALVGALALAVAAISQWGDVTAVGALLALSLTWAVLDRLDRIPDARWYALGSFALALIHLLDSDLPARPAAQAAFVGAWALALWGSGVSAAILAAAVSWQRRNEGPARIAVAPLLWGVAGLVLFLGVTGELIRAFRLSRYDRATADLAGGLSVSAWWILFAAGCFLFGFRRRLKPLRLTGFLVAGLALVKVVFVDLSTLSAFYRIGSALILGVVSLGVAYAYHRGAGEQGSRGAGEQGSRGAGEQGSRGAVSGER